MSQSTFKQPTLIIQAMMKAYIAKVNDALDGHVRPIEYNDCLDPRSGMVEGMKAALEATLPSFNAMMEQEGVAPEMRRMIINNLSK